MFVHPRPYIVTLIIQSNSFVIYTLVPGLLRFGAPIKTSRASLMELLVCILNSCKSSEGNSAISLIRPLEIILQCHWRRIGYGEGQTLSRSYLLRDQRMNNDPKRDGSHAK